MAESRSLVSHVETYVASSTSTSQQKASVDEIAELLKKGTLTVESLVRELELYLTTTDSVIRGRGVALLAEVLGRLSTKKLNQATVNSLADFFSAKLADWQVVHGALLGCLSLVRRRHNVGIVQGNSAVDIAKSYLLNLQVQLLAQNDRLLCFQLLQCLLDFYPKDVSSLGEDLIYGICAAIDNEKDPHCLLLTFHIVQSLGRLFPEPSGPVASFAEELFDILSRYFPIYFTHASDNVSEIKRDDLADALMLAFSSTSFFEPFAIPLLLEKLSSSLLSAKVDSLKYLSNCILHYKPESMAKHLKSIWYSLKEVIFNYSGQESFILISEYIRDKDTQENQVYKEAINCLQAAISKLNDPNHSFIGYIFKDEEFDESFFSVANELSYKSLSEENKRKLHAVGTILNISTNVSHYYSDLVFQRYFSRLMEIIGVSSCKSGSDWMDIENTTQRELKFGAMYLSIGILCSCLDMLHLSEGFLREPAPYENTWQYLLLDFHRSLANSFASVIGSHDLIVRSEDGCLENIYYAVKGLQTLAMFPRNLVQISDAVYEDIIMILMSNLLTKYGDSSFWKFILKALVELGHSLEKSPDSHKEAVYESLALERIMSELCCDDSDVWFSLKLDAAFVIGTSRPKLMSNAIKKLVSLIFRRLTESISDVRSRSTANLVCLLVHYSSQVLPWCSEAGYYEEAVTHFVIELWDKVEGLSILHLPYESGQEITDALMMTLKTAMGICKEQDQFQILEKACMMIHYRIFPSTVDSEPLCSVKLNPKLLQYSYDYEFSGEQKILFSLFVSVLVALRPQTVLPDLNMILNWLMIFFWKGHYTAAHGLGSIVNKWPKENDKSMLGSCSLEDVLDCILCEDVIAGRAGVPMSKCSSDCMQEKGTAYVDVHDISGTDWISGLAWIGKGLLMRGDARVKDVVMIFLKYLLPDKCMEAERLDIGKSFGRSVADAFEVLLSDSDIALNKKFHAMIKPLYKQKFFLIVTPLLLSCISEANVNSRTNLYRAFGNVICNTPQAVLIPEAKKLILPLIEGLSQLIVDIINKELIYNMLLVFSGFLIDDNGKEAIMDNSNKIISCILGLTSYPHMMLVRETAIQCLVAFSDFPYSRIYPMRRQVLQAMSKALDDKKRQVRLEAVKCLRTWISLA